MQLPKLFLGGILLQAGCALAAECSVKDDMLGGFKMSTAAIETAAVQVCAKKDCEIECTTEVRPPDSMNATLHMWQWDIRSDFHLCVVSRYERIPSNLKPPKSNPTLVTPAAAAAANNELSLSFPPI
ncbi:MAG: hypothetical protein M1818_004216 [Claussenomyces sp. TS43310]|nr:MAG: hypothetical protein M1818_004216 [Claussenomyces sp. TS43310]